MKTLAISTIILATLAFGCHAQTMPEPQARVSTIPPQPAPYRALTISANEDGIWQADGGTREAHITYLNQYLAKLKPGEWCLATIDREDSFDATRVVLTSALDGHLLSVVITGWVRNEIIDSYRDDPGYQHETLPDGTDRYTQPNGHANPKTASVYPPLKGGVTLVTVDFIPADD